MALRVLSGVFIFRRSLCVCVCHVKCRMQEVLNYVHFVNTCSSLCVAIVCILYSKEVKMLPVPSNFKVTNCLQRALYIRANKWGLLPSKHKLIRIVQPKLGYVTVALLTKSNTKNISDNTYIKGDVCHFVAAKYFLFLA